MKRESLLMDSLFLCIYAILKETEIANVKTQFYNRMYES